MRETEAPGKAETGNERGTGKDRDRQATDRRAPREARIDKREGEGVEKGRERGGERGERQTDRRTNGQTDRLKRTARQKHTETQEKTLRLTDDRDSGTDKRHSEKETLRQTEIKAKRREKH